MKICTNCPGSSDHNTADCPLMRATAHIEDGEEVEVVGYRVSMPGEPELGTWLDEEAEEEPQIQHHEPLMTVAQHQRIVAALIKKANRYDWLRSQQIMLPGHDFLSTGEILDQRIDDKLPAPPAADAPYAPGIADDLERSDWTPEEALRWYASGRHFDVVDGRTRIIDTGAVASNALKHASLEYLEMKGDAELAELREKVAPPAAGVPEGWKLVPVEPTAEMWAAFRNTDHGNIWFHQAYRAMLAAAPTPPASEQQRAVVMPERKTIQIPDLATFPGGPASYAKELDKARAHNACLDELLRLNPHLAKGEGV